jgi:hypothetical protein
MTQTEPPPWIRPCIVLHFGEQICVVSDAPCATVIQRQIPLQISNLFIILVCLVSNHLTKHDQGTLTACLFTLVVVSVNHWTFSSPRKHKQVFVQRYWGPPPYNIRVYNMEFTRLKVSLWFQDAHLCNSFKMHTSVTACIYLSICPESTSVIDCIWIRKEVFQKGTPRFKLGRSCPAKRYKHIRSIKALPSSGWDRSFFVSRCSCFNNCTKKFKWKGLVAFNDKNKYRINGGGGECAF